jgi:hypothetical protein
MADVPTIAGAPTAFDKEISEFIEFLDQNRPARAVASSLTTLLRTRPPVQFGPERVTEIIVEWAQRRAVRSVGSVLDNVLAAVTMIVQAHQEGCIVDFDPRAFMRGFTLAAPSKVPADQKEEFLARLPEFLDGLPRTWRSRGDDGTAGDTIEVFGTTMSIDAALDHVVGRLEKNPYMEDDEFEQIVDYLEMIFSSPVGVSVQAGFVKTAKAAIGMFNATRVARASRLFLIIEDAYEHLRVGKERRQIIGGELPSSQLNQAILWKWVNNPERHDEVAPTVRFFTDLDPSNALPALALEQKRDQRRFLLNVMAIHGEVAYEQIIQQILSPDSQQQGWYYLRNLIYLVAHLGVPKGADRRRAIDAVGRYATHEAPQLRGIAIAALRRIGGKEVLPYGLKALEPSSYGQIRTEEIDAVLRNLVQAMELVMDSGVESAIAVVAEFATGARGGEFEIKELRDSAIKVLGQRRAPLPHRAAQVIAEQIKQMASKKLKIVTGKLTLGIDAPYCRALMGLLEDTPYPDVREVLEHPVVHRLAEKPL